jgi:hypothetical protein
MVPEGCADAVISGRKSMVVFMVLEQSKWQVIGAVVSAVMHKQIPSISDQRACYYPES